MKIGSIEIYKCNVLALGSNIHMITFEKRKSAEELAIDVISRDHNTLKHTEGFGPLHYYFKL